MIRIFSSGQNSRWDYDQYGRVTNKLDQVSAVILRYKYDANNRLTNRWSAAKGDTFYAYDPLGNLTNINYPSSPDVAFAYDALNRMTNMVDGIGTTKYTYTAAGQLLTEDGPFTSDTVTNIYSNRLRVGLSLQQLSGVWTNSFAYDSTKRLTNVTSPAGAFGYVYDPTLLTHHPSLVALPNTSYITNAFDGDARLIATYLKKSDNSTFDSYTYIYNPANQRTNLTRADSSTVAYKYDPIGQLKVADSSVNSEDRGYAYDAAWNLIIRTNKGSGTTFLVDGKNQLHLDSNYSYTYDANGNLTRRDSGVNTNALYQYTYDDENRLVSILNDNAPAPQSAWWETDFVYDGLGRLRKRTEYASYAGNWLHTNAFVSYIYDGWRVIQERNYANNSPSVSYTRGNDLSGTKWGAGGIGGLLARTTPSPTTHSYYFADGNGNVTYMLNSSQAMVAKYRYDPFGNTNSSSGTLADANVYRFSSKEVHANSGMYYYGYRFYDPYLQRWINRDLIGDRVAYLEIHRREVPQYILPQGELLEGINLYEFVRNAPPNTIDSDGRGALPLPIPIPIPIAGPLLSLGLAACYAVPSCRSALANAAKAVANAIAGGCQGETPYNKAKRECIDQCSDSSLPTRDHGFTFYNCVQDCLERKGFQGVEK